MNKGEKMKKLIGSIALLLGLSVSVANADSLSTRPNIFGGVDIYSGYNGHIGSTRPNIFGGVDLYSGSNGHIGSTRPNIFGGFDLYK